MTKPWEADGIRYERECGTDGCDHVFGVPDIHALVEDEQICPRCGERYKIDVEDRNTLIAWLLARMERLERQLDPLGGLGI